jgi:hypothetical protein
MSNHDTAAFEPDLNLVEMWTRKDPSRWIAGAIAGIVAGIVSLLVAGLVSVAGGYEFFFAPKLAGTILLGATATNIGPHFGAIIAGFVLYEIVAAFLGFVYAHFVFSNAKTALFPMGFVWGVFSWIFIWNLFLQSFRQIFATQLPAGPVFLVCIAFGLSLSSVALFSRGANR